MSSTRPGFLVVCAVVMSLPIVLSCVQHGSPRPGPATPRTGAAATAVRQAERTKLLAVAASGPCNTNGAAPALGCSALPNTTAVGEWVDSTGTALSPQPANGQTAANAYLDYDLWAWNSFAAMNWPALDPAANNNMRGFPDPNQSFVAAKSTDTTVWETYKEKREVFLYDYVRNVPSSEVPQPWNSAPQYGPASAQVPCCPGATCDAAVTRQIGSQSKLFFDTLDETAEVASEALETQAVLCNGWVNPATQCTGSPNDNPCCTLNGRPVGPRVWRGDPSSTQATPVVYEVKVNYDSFNYIIANQLYTVGTARSAATKGSIRLPARTSASAMPPTANSKGSGSGPNPGPVNYSAANCANAQTYPCSAGAVHLKAAWLQLTPGVDDFSKYHTATAFQYFTNSMSTGQVCMAPATFGLIGLHIIQRIHQTGQNTFLGSGSSTGQPRGGTYVFATWEHVDNDTAGFTYVNYPTSGPQVPYPNLAQVPALPLNRVYPPLASTARATALVHSILGCSGAPDDSVWCNYELIGTQYAATQTPSPIPAQLDALVPQSANIEAPPNSGQPYYLANLVVESNVGLQQFQGLPPTGDPNVITVIDHYASNHVTSQFGSVFQRSAENVASRTMKDTNHQFTMGGCMGCHGVAQLSGYSFSFVLLDNQYGAIPDTQAAFTIPPTPDQPSQ